MQSAAAVLAGRSPPLFDFFLTAMLSDLHGMLCELSKLPLVSLDCSLSMLFAPYSILVTAEKNFHGFR